jgi:hypothetical protein
MASVLWAVIILGVLFATGAPLAFCLRSRYADWAEMIFEALAIGLLVQISIAIIALRTAHFSLTALGVMTLVIAGSGVAIAVARHVQWPRMDRPWLLVTLALVVVALFLRRHPSYFLWESGDMGEYVNRANRVADGANLVQSFPHGFTMYLASTRALLGEAHTVAGLPALGIVLLLGTIELARRLRLRLGAVLLIAVVIVIHPVAVWFSQFPASEALYAPLLISALYFLVRARVESSTASGVVSGLLFGLMLIVRGNAILLAPILVVALFASAAADSDATYRVQRSATAAALASLSVAYCYDVHYPHAYFVQKQMTLFLPKFAFDAADRLKLFDTTPVLIIVLIAALAIVLFLADRVRRLVHRAVESSEVRFWRVAYGAVVVITVVAFVFIKRSGLVDGLERWDALLLILALAGGVLVAINPGRHVDGTIGFFILCGIAAYTVLFAVRLPTPRSHPYYLYTDRYLFSEVLPLALVLATVGAHAVIEGIAHLQHRVRLARAVAIAALVFVGAGLIPPAAETWQISGQTLFGDAYGTMHRLKELAGGEGKTPIVYSGVKQVPAGFFFGNTYRVFAMPLNETFGRRIVGTNFKNDHPDPIFDPASARAALGRAGLSSGYLVDLRDAGAQPFPDDEHTRYVGTIDYSIPVLNRSLDRSKERFHDVRVQLDVYALS